MAFKISGPLRVLEYRDGKPVFDIPPAPASEQPQAPVVQPAATPPPEAAPARPKRGRANKFGASCARCKNWVEAGKGLRSKDGEEWITVHADKCPASPVARPEPAPTKAADPHAGDGPRRGPIRTPDGSEPLTGYFTAQFGDDDGDYVTIRIRRQAADANFKPGKLLVGYLRGSDNEGDYTTIADIDASGRCWMWQEYKENQRFRKAIASVLGDQRAAGEAWSRVSESCWRCHIRLTTPESLERLMGEDCWNKLYG